MEITREDIDIQSTMQKNKTFPMGKTYLFFMGIDKYKNGINELNNAVRDAKDVATSLIENYEFDKENLKILINSKVTKSAILKAFDKYQDIMTKDDNLIFYFSGHGYYHKKTQKGYWLTSESKSNERDTYLSNDEIMSFLRHLDARHVFGIVDACFAGALFTDRDVSEVASKRLNFPSRWLLTAGRLEPVSDGSLGENSPFAKALLAQLNYNSGSQIWISDLCQMVLKGVEYNTDKQLPRGEPLQGVGHYGGDYVLVRKGFSFSPPKSIKVSEDTASNKDFLNVEDDDSKLEETSIQTIEGNDLINIKSNLLKKLEENKIKMVFTNLKKLLVEEGKTRQILRQLNRSYNHTLDIQMLGVQDDRSIEIKYNQLNNKLEMFIENLVLDDMK